MLQFRFDYAQTIDFLFEKCKKMFELGIFVYD
jgi:hypothetical protein